MLPIFFHSLECLKTFFSKASGFWIHKQGLCSSKPEAVSTGGCQGHPAGSARRGQGGPKCFGSRWVQSLGAAAGEWGGVAQEAMAFGKPGKVWKMIFLHSYLVGLLLFKRKQMNCKSSVVSCWSVRAVAMWCGHPGLSRRLCCAIDKLFVWSDKVLKHQAAIFLFFSGAKLNMAMGYGSKSKTLDSQALWRGWFALKLQHADGVFLQFGTADAARPGEWRQKKQQCQ